MNKAGVLLVGVCDRANVDAHARQDKLFTAVSGLTFMSIAPILDEHLEMGRLVELASLFTGDETARAMIISLEILAVVTPPFPDSEEGVRLGEFRAWLDSFMEGAEISVAEYPFQKPSDAMLSRVDPVESELWSIRVTEPHETPGVRSFGGFAEKDKFIALTWDFREMIPHFDDAVSSALSAWEDLFGSNGPFKGDGLDEYLTNYRAV